MHHRPFASKSFKNASVTQSGRRKTSRANVLTVQFASYLKRVLDMARLIFSHLNFPGVFTSLALS